jgi:MFS family permease
MVTGIFQRAPIVFVGLVLLYAADARPSLALASVALAPLVSGLAMGFGFTAWQQLLTHTLPPRRRSSVFAARYIIAAAMGIGAGWVVRSILVENPGARGYGLLHLYAFALVMLSYVIFSLIRERDREVAPGARVRMADNLRSLPAIVGRDARLRRFLAARGILNGIFIVIPFMAIHARDTLGAPEGLLGELTMAHMIGAFAGNIASGYLGDRFGGKLVTIVGQAAFLIVVGGALLAGSAASFYAVFFVFGFAFYAIQVGTNVLRLEICPPERRATALAVVAAVNLPTMLAATALSAALAGIPGGFTYLAASAGACTVASTVLLAPLRDPRNAEGRNAPS